jgi:serine phosphatase RsbU (regulator of sigma subunit)
MPLTALKDAVTIDMLPGDILMLLSDGIYECRNRRDQEFGEARVQALVQAHHGKSAAEWLTILFDSVAKFTDGTHKKTI